MVAVSIAAVQRTARLVRGCPVPCRDFFGQLGGTSAGLRLTLCSSSSSWQGFGNLHLVSGPCWRMRGTWAVRPRSAVKSARRCAIGRSVVSGATPWPTYTAVLLAAEGSLRAGSRKAGCLRSHVTPPGRARCIGCCRTSRSPVDLVGSVGQFVLIPDSAARKLPISAAGVLITA